MKNQKGFSLLAVVLFFAIAGIVAATGWYVWSKNQSVETPQENVQQLDVKKTATTQDLKTAVPDGYALYESQNPKLSFVYPKEWDKHAAEGWGRGVKVEIYDVGAKIPLGFGAPFSMIYDQQTKQWIQVDENSGERTAPTIQVIWKDDKKTVYNLGGGDGPCGQSRPTVISDKKVFRILTPTLCSRELNFDGKPGEVYLDNAVPAVSETSIYYQELAKSINTQ